VKDKKEQKETAEQERDKAERLALTRALAAFLHECWEYE
jgi:hypothetical protein